MREIKFRGYGTDDKKRGWIYGNLLIEKIVDLVCIQDENCHVWEVEPESVGQYTGLKDEDGRDVYEGDVMAYKDSTSTLIKGRVWYRNGGFFVTHPKRVNGYLLNVVTGEFLGHVIGNIYDNPDLLEATE